MTSRRAGIALSVVDGESLSGRIDGLLESLRLSEKRESDADELEFTLTNTDGAIAMPPTGAKLSLQLGWIAEPTGLTGLVDKGLFVVDEVSLQGPPNLIIVTARSADLTGALREKRTQSWRDTTLGAILDAIAARHGRSVFVAPDLASLAIEVIEQEGKSDMAFLRDLGKRYDAIATWKNDALLFLPIGASNTASGQALPVLNFQPRDGFTWSARETGRDRYDGARAQWHNQNTGRRHTVSVGGTENPRKLKRVYASEAEARQAAQATFSRDKRSPWTFELGITIADPALGPDMRAKLTGWSPRLDELSWLIESVETSYDGQGLRQRLTFESV